MLKGLLGQATEHRTHLIIHGVIPMVAHKPHDGGAYFRTRPKAACGHLADDLHIVVKLHPDASQSARLRAFLRRKALRNLRLHQHDDRFRGGRLFEGLRV